MLGALRRVGHSEHRPEPLPIGKKQEWLRTDGRGKRRRVTLNEPTLLLGPVRARPVEDLAAPIPWRRAVPLVAVQKLSLAVLITVYWFLDARDSVPALLLVPPVVSFFPVVANSSAPG